MTCRRCEKQTIYKYYESDFHNIYKCKSCDYEEIIKIDDCCRNPNKIIVNDPNFFPNFRLYEQCINCGGTKRNFPLKHTKDIEIRDEFNVDTFNTWRKNISFDKKIIYEYVQEANYLSSPRGKYHAYLNSDEWKKKEKLFLLGININVNNVNPKQPFTFII
ncbi:hypothetical protein BBI01_03660 [Chryseobacterium artocarpi]|uniref:Uncharacterized protein n=1 Tax=Chryseobacterium artocarpi TaxID=1414727 RepID=A0A1B9A112_9FLAO|nr:hypothetical protein [Chryseobacterium artocarpi]OCA77556.1 hypothetical protein BBI01_03660 [Chryseobacterium artocarpi]